ncbi:MAG TPA: hypothetical protein VN950_06935 [Terriglobales bacterium]|nr:hypothetical protein [Terriglobales bacterium]
MALNNETRTLMRLLKFRAIGLWHAELAHSPGTAKQYSALVGNPALSPTGPMDEGFTLGVGRLLLANVLERTRLGVSIAPRLCPELAEIFWAALSESLIERSVCDYKNFGIFRVSRATGKLHVVFEPSAVLNGRPLLEPQSSPYQDEQFVDEYTRRVMDPLLQEVQDYPDFGAVDQWRIPLIATWLLTKALDDILHSVVSSKEINGITGEMPRDVERERDWLTVVAMATGYASYYAWIIAFCVDLRTNSRISVDGIGRFQRTVERIEFEPVAQLQRMLDVNIPMARQTAA